MPSKNSPSINRLERNGWLLLIATFAVVLGLGLAFLLILQPWRMVEQTEVGGFNTLARGATGVGLLGLIFIFVLYTTLKNLELNRLRDAFQQEATEHENVRARLSELSLMFRVTSSLRVALPVDTVLEVIVRRVVAALKAQQASIMLLEESGEYLHTKAFYGVEGEYASHARVKVGENVAGIVAQRNEPVIVDSRSDLTDKPWFKPHRNITSALCVPLANGDQCIGVLNVNRISYPEPFTDSQLELVKVFAHHVGSVIVGAEEIEHLGSKAKNLQDDNQRLAQMNQMKDIFLSTASHELKTPLTSIIGYSELLGDHSGELNPAQRIEFAGRLNDEAHRLLSLIDDILDITRLETGKLKLKAEMVSVNGVVKSAVESTWSLAANEKVTILAKYDDALGDLSLDESKIRQTVVNLIGNAIKFSPEGSEVEVRTRDTGDACVIDVMDRGPGVPDDERDQIFALFGQGVKPVRGSKGLGIGLHLVKRIVELHGGQVGVSDRREGGSRFWVRLPLAGPAETTGEHDRAA